MTLCIKVSMYLMDVCCSDESRLFSPKELNSLLTGGEDVDIDVRDLQKYTKYSGGYSKSSSTVNLFWKVLGSLNTEERSAFLKFVTSCSRPPLGGFKHMQPPLTLHKVFSLEETLTLERVLVL